MKSKAMNIAHVTARQRALRSEWTERIKKLAKLGHANVIHHLTRRESKLAAFYFKTVGRLDKDPQRPSITNISQYCNMTPLTLRRVLRMRVELLFCTTMKRLDHNRFHAKLRKEKSI